MTAVDDEAGAALPQRPRNWWKWAFVAMALAFECTREWAVAASYAEPQAAVLPSMTTFQDITTVSGSWRRIDGGEDLQAGAVSLACYRDQGRCWEADYSISNGTVSAPDITWYEARWTEDSISYEDEVPTCVRYAVRIDLRLEKVFATRVRKAEAREPTCDKLERRIEMTLGDGYRPYRPDQEHFLPFASLLSLIFDRSGGKS